MFKHKSRVFKDTRSILIAAFPVLLAGLKEVSDAIPTPAGSIIKGIVQTTIFIMDKVEVSHQVLNHIERPENDHNI